LPPKEILKARPRSFSFEHAQLLAKRKDLEAQDVSGTKEGTKADDETKKKVNHESGFITQRSIRASALSY
jgi:hypothetical protein